MESFARTYSADGWRYSVAYRTRPDSFDGVVGWPVQKWNGEHWIRIGVGSSYADARRIATDHAEIRVELQAFDTDREQAKRELQQQYPDGVTTSPDA